jgi:CrcB protein
MGYLLVALGGALGSVLRYACAGIGVRLFGATFPWSTLFVNVSGSFAIGLLASLATADAKPLVTGDARAFLMIGVLGGYTTFSSFSLETLNLARTGQLTAAGWNAGASVVLCLVGVWLGYFVGGAFNR